MSLSFTIVSRITMLKQLSIVFLSLATCASYAQVYKWTDSQGVVHFSDKPHTGAVSIDNIESQSYSASAPPPTEDTSTEVKQEPQKKVVYSKVAIVQPQDQVTIRNNQGYVVVTAEIVPNLQANHQVQVLLDGKPQGAPQTSLMFQLNGIYRGSHNLAVQVINSEGKVIKTSPQIVIYMQRPRVGMVKGSAS